MVVRARPASRLASWWPEVALLGGFVALTAALSTGLFLDWDVAVYRWCSTHQVWVAHAASRALYFLGSSNVIGPLTLVPAAVLVVRHRSTRPLLPTVTTYVLLYGLTGPIKVLADRAAPKSPNLDKVELWADPTGMSYPSGHMVNSIIWYQVLVLLLDAVLRSLGRHGLPDRVRLALRILPPIIVAVTITYLSYHWLTDTAAALLLGLFIDRVLRRIQWGVPLQPASDQ